MIAGRPDGRLKGLCDQAILATGAWWLTGLSGGTQTIPPENPAETVPGPAAASETGAATWRSPSLPAGRSSGGTSPRLALNAIASCGMSGAKRAIAGGRRAIYPDRNDVAETQ